MSCCEVYLSVASEVTSGTLGSIATKFSWGRAVNCFISKGKYVGAFSATSMPL